MRFSDATFEFNSLGLALIEGKNQAAGKTRSNSMYSPENHERERWEVSDCENSIRCTTHNKIPRDKENEKQTEQ